MSLSSLLLASGPKKLDTELDALFKSNPALPRKPATSINVPTNGSAPPAKKRKIETAVPEPQEGRKKRVKPEKPAAAPKPSPRAKTSAKIQKSQSKQAAVENSEESGDDEDNSDLENAYLGKKLPNKPTAPSPDSDDEADVPSDAESGESDPDAPPPVHESLTKRVRTKTAKKKKIVPQGETSVQRDTRTLFIGGLPVEVAEKKALQKQLARHILSFLPSSSKVKIESTRFRSVAFRDPTSSTALSSTTTPASPNVTANSVPVPAGSNHSKARASTWRQTGAADEKAQAEADGDQKKEYLTPAQKKKILFIQGAFHPEAKGVNAYVVLAHHSDAPGENDADSPYSVALHIARAANASEFMERTLRVDVCARQQGTAAGDAEGTGAQGDPKLSIFIGNLDFASRENDVREFFEGVVAAERGPASESEDSSGRWVQNVRLIRDRETQLGKGFGYVRFVDRECVDEILALAKTDEGKTKLKFAKRTLRIQRCRAVGASSGTTKLADATAKSSASKSKSTYPAAPPKRGDPTLGARLAHLDKDARKAAKNADADRLLRRAEKKKLGTRMRVGAANDKMKAVSGGGGKRLGGGGRGSSNDKGKGKDRERERKVRFHKSSSASKGRK
ncbi:hypothetical protein C8F04DRAFT_1002886 [Mycena alexandri]|uniref:Nucleolar protein 12 n=1 Tax=Mycena alexandri TaxID=1745969 RepID=A0AAD6X600_9AGAR|nr:hypothetical protein C8F04DRAFT_1002886 [Mycena alexandri]